MLAYRDRVAIDGVDHNRMLTPMMCKSMTLHSCPVGFIRRVSNKKIMTLLHCIDGVPHTDAPSITILIHIAIRIIFIVLIIVRYRESHSKPLLIL